MAASIVVSDDLDAILTAMAVAGIRHPTDLTKVFLGTAVSFTFSLDEDDLPVVTLGEAETHLWPYASEPASTFDDRVLS